MEQSYLYLIPTPISENAAISAEVKQVVNNLKVFYVEKEKIARRFIKKVNKAINIDDLTLIPMHKETLDFNEVYNVLSANSEQSIGVLSDAGCPGIADPGAEVVRVAHEIDMKVIPLIGPSSILLALMASGFSGQNFSFNGYLPIDKKLRIQKIKELERLSIQNNSSQIFMETPYRNTQLMEVIKGTCNENTELCIAYNITAKNQVIKSKTIALWKNENIAFEKNPCIFIIYRRP